MWHKTQNDALLVALRLAERQIDPELLIKRAREQGVKLPVRCEYVSAPSLGGGVRIAYQVEDIPAFRSAIDGLMARKAA